MAGDHRGQVIVQLLQQLHELTDPVRAGNGDGQTGLLLMPHAKECALFGKRWPPACSCHLRSLAELERLLRVMREDELTTIEHRDGRLALRTLWWHLNERYLRCERSTKNVWWQQARWRGLSSHQEVVAQPGGWQLALATERGKRGRASLAVRVLVVSWHPAVRADVVEAGVAWLSESWALEVEPMLPRVPKEQRAA